MLVRKVTMINKDNLFSFSIFFDEFMKILVTGGCGYKGHVLIPKLLNNSHLVITFDIQWFGNFLKPHSNLKVVKGDVRNIDEVPLEGVE